MTGKSHLITGVCALEHGFLINIMARHMIQNSVLNPIIEPLYEFGYLRLGFADLSPTAFILYMGLYFIGVLLPDIDNEKSILGRIVHVPIEHRTWVHSIYPYIPVILAGLFLPSAYSVFIWLFMGVFVHLFWDSFSVCGNCWFYKLLSDYRKYPGGAKIKKGHHLKLYRTGEWSEYLLLFVIVVMTVVSFIWVTKGNFKWH